jgi:hypothetical protein
VGQAYLYPFSFCIASSLLFSSFLFYHLLLSFYFCFVLLSIYLYNYPFIS